MHDIQVSIEITEKYIVTINACQYIQQFDHIS